MSAPRKRIPLQLKISMIAVAIVTIPLVIAYLLVGQIGKTAANVASSDAAARIEAMDRAILHYYELVNTTKRLHSEIAAL